jgi:hypothetical protein
MERIGISAEAVNVANTEGQSVQLDAPTAQPGAEKSDACVIAILVTLPQRGLQGLLSGGDKETVMALERLATLPGREFDALYFYYAPNASEPMDPHAANRLFLDLKATAGARSERVKG